jgi:hypothetical protein
MRESESARKKGLAWRKSTFSEAGDCVEVAPVEDGFLVRDSKARNGPVLEFSSTEWNEFLSAAREGRFDLGRLTADGPWRL